MFNGNGAFMKFLIIFMFASNIIFTITILIIFCITLCEPPTLVDKWFMFTCSEAGVLGLIKICKVAKGYKKKEVTDDGFTDDYN